MAKHRGNLTESDMDSLYQYGYAIQAFWRDNLNETAIDCAAQIGRLTLTGQLESAWRCGMTAGTFACIFQPSKDEFFVKTYKES